MNSPPWNEEVFVYTNLINSTYFYRAISENFL